VSEPAVLGQREYDDAFRLLAEMSQDFADSMDLDRTLRNALQSITRYVGAEAGSLWLVESEGSELACLASVGANPITGMRLPASKGIIGRSVRENSCQMVLDATKDPHFAKAVDEKSGFRTRSILCAPLRLASGPIGAIELINKRTEDGRFDEGDAHVLQVLASSAALAVANARLAASQVEHERVRRELELAAEIQRNLLPAPRPAPFPVHAVNVPARTVSGDFYDFLAFEDGRVVFCLGDVSGKGMNAALLMAKTASLYRCLARSMERPGELIAKLNEEVCETATRGMFVTLAAGSFEPATGRVCLANAGHVPPLLHARGSFRELPAQAPPLGIVPGQAFPEAEIALDGGTLYVCSDGLTEAPRADGGQLGTEGFENLVERFAGKPLADRIEAVAAEVGELALRDDLTLLGVSGEGG
jgi:sigma-B regulation protein RsbU (phosphoserine phosphatase)